MAYYGGGPITAEFDTGPYGELFDLPEIGDYDINLENPSSEDIARIQQDPNLQMQYIQNLMKGGDYFSDYKAPGSNYDPHFMMQQALGSFFESGFSVEDFMNLKPGSETTGGGASILSILFGGGEIDGKKVGSPDLFGFSGDYYQNPEDYADLVNYIQDLQSGIGRLQGGDIGIGSLLTELGLTERGVTGPGGLSGQKGTMADVLSKNISRRREQYIPQEKVSRYGKLTGTGGGIDPTSGYETGVWSDVGKYGAGVEGIDKSIFDILYGTDEGSIFDVYEDYGDLVKKSLVDPSGEMWYGG